MQKFGAEFTDTDTQILYLNFNTTTLLYFRVGHDCLVALLKHNSEENRSILHIQADTSLGILNG